MTALQEMQTKPWVNETGIVYDSMWTHLKLLPFRGACYLTRVRLFQTVSNIMSGVWCWMRTVSVTCSKTKISNGEGLQHVSETCYDDGGTDKKTGGRARGGRVDNAKTFTDQNGQDSK